jgi:subtilase family serine protease
MGKIVAVVGIVALTACGSAVDTPSAVGQREFAAASAARSHVPVCPGPAREGDTHCHSHVMVDVNGTPVTGSTPVAGSYGPADLQAAYNLPAGSGTPTIAIVDAYDDPTAESDLAVYRATFGLPPCTTANGCFRKVDQAGGTNYPRKNAGWALEISLDLDMASAICPNCKLLLVEAKTNSFANLAAAVDYAAGQGVVAISNSYGAAEFSSEVSYESHFNHPGIAITVSSGDGGYGVEYPAASRYVTAVGGTALTRNASVPRGWTETVWNDAYGAPGSGCSAYVSKPSWQTDAGCANRTVADVSAVADPLTGVAVYDSTPFHGQAGWFQVGGTSASSPIVAGVYALAGNAVTAASYPYAHATSLYDVTSGSDGSCGGSYLCTAVAGYDGPTGLGTPNGTGSF